MRATFVIVVILIAEGNIFAESCNINWQGKEEAIIIFQDLADQPSLCDSAAAVRSLNDVIIGLQGKGYLLSAFAYERDSSAVIITCYLGEPYRWARLDPGNVPQILFSKSSILKSDLVDQVFSVKKFSKLIRDVVINSENSGFPFASVRLDSIYIEGAEVSAQLRYEAGPRITFDSLLLPENIRTKRKWLESYLGIKQGVLFSQKLIDNIADNIGKLSFLDLSEPPSVTFQNKEATIAINIVEKKVSTIDGIVGFLPKEEESGSLLVTGQIDLSLHNLFKSGKRLGIKWQSLKARSQLLDIAYFHPNLFSSAVNFEGNFNLLKEDTLFLTRKTSLNLSYQTNQNSLKIFSQFISSGLLGTGSLNDITTLPETVDLNTNYYGVGYAYSKLDRIFAPKNGLFIQTEIAVGSKEIERNSDIPDQLYDDIDLSSVQYSFEVLLGSYLRLGNNLVFHSTIEGGTVINDQLFLNDLYRIGGLNSLRGFNENFFFAENYINGTIEAQFHFQEYSYLFAFYDQAYLHYDLSISSFEDYPFGVGLGLSLFTGTGSVNLVYALGKSNEQPLSLNLSKFHFGYVARF
ncbi:MAG: BamA/TamA family outer membrane protein [Bacteroidota bacterium]